MINSRLRMKMVPKREEEILEVLRSLAERTRVKPGCVSCSVCRDTEVPSVVVLDEVWRSEGEMERHLRSEEYLKVLLVMEMAEEAPEIQFDTVVSRAGAEAIEKARSKHGDGD